MADSLLAANCRILTADQYNLLLKTLNFATHQLLVRVSPHEIKPDDVARLIYWLILFARCWFQLLDFPARAR